VGYAIVTYNFDLEYGGMEAMLTDLYVDKRYRNKGIGSLALYEIEDFCRERGIRTIELQVQHHNKSAETFYRKAGFRILPRKVMLLDVRPEEVARAHRATASKRR
jgi:ribosomal protein S18 acetylase RimI-like enzyme